MMAAPIFLYSVFFLVAGTLYEETSALTIKKLKVRRRRDLWDEANVRWANAQDDVKFNLATNYGTLTSKSLQQLDTSLKVMMGGILEMDISETYTWDELLSTLNKNRFLTRQPQYSKYRLSKMIFNIVRIFGIGESKRKRLRSINTWFSNLVGNVDVLKDTDIDSNVIANMLSKITVKLFKNLLTAKTRKGSLMDLGILRFPDISKPFFSLYRINLMAKSTYKSYIFHQKEKSELVGLFEKQIYYPDKDYIYNLSGDFMNQLLREVDDLFSDY